MTKQPDPLDEEWRLPQLPRGKVTQRDWLECHRQRMHLVMLACKWREAALANGWKAHQWQATENRSDSCTLTREGFWTIIITRSRPADFRELPTARVTLWLGETRLPTGRHYDWQAIIAHRAPEDAEGDQIPSPLPYDGGYESRDRR